MDILCVALRCPLRSLWLNKTIINMLSPNLTASYTEFNAELLRNYITLMYKQLISTFFGFNVIMHH
jgi:hypothetical protein